MNIIHPQRVFLDCFSKKIILIAGLVAGLCSGCLFEPYYPTRVFDFPPTEKTAHAEIAVEEFINSSSSNYHMQRRESNGEVHILPYCRWVLPPGALVSRGLAAQFQAKSYFGSVGGEIRTFEIDGKAQCFHLSGSFRLKGRISAEAFDITVPLENDTPEAAAHAAGEAVAQLARQIASSRDNIRKP